MNRSLRPLGAAAIFAPLLLSASSAGAIDVTLTANLINSCILTISTPGQLTAATDGRSLGSENSGGVPAAFGMVAIGAAPTLRFQAPTLTSPAGWSGSPTVRIRYTSLGGADQAYTSATTTYSGSALLDTFTVQGRVDNDDGFAGGQYVVHTLVTCQQ